MSEPRNTALADLRILPLEQITPHEDHDERRIVALAERVQRDARCVVRNPPIVAPLGDGRFVVLDGANRTSALRYLEYPDAIVQMVDYASVQLSTWNHMVIEFQGESIEQDIGQIPGLAMEQCTREQAAGSLEGDAALGSMYLPDGRCISLKGTGSLVEHIETMRFRGFCL